MEGGLGIRRLRDISRVFALSLIWKLLTMSGSLWVAWSTHHLMWSGPFGTAPSTNLGSWIWKKLLKLRDLAASFVQVEIGDGYTASFWCDHWLPQGRLVDIIGTSGAATLGISLTARVAEAADDTGWKLQRSFARRYPQIHSHIQSTAPPNATAGADCFLWKQRQDTYKNSFSSTCTWELIRNIGIPVTWNKAIWFNQSIPRCGFITC